MSASVNKVILVGNLGADPEIKRTQDGRPIANLRIATSETWRDKSTGERKEKTSGTLSSFSLNRSARLPSNTCARDRRFTLRAHSNAQMDRQGR